MPAQPRTSNSDILKAVLWVQLILISCLAIFFADRWHVLEICAAALVGFWSTTLFIWFRRRQSGLTPREHLFLWWGYLPFLIAFWLIGRLL